MITRFAPTPSGYLHVGNAANALLVAWLAAQADAVIALRIDDVDATRARPEYVEDIFNLMAWLSIPWAIGPRDSADFTSHHSMTRSTERYRSKVTAARARGLDAYACACSRTQVTAIPTGGCPGGCRGLSLPLVPGKTALRMHVPIGTDVIVGSRVVHLDKVMGDFVIWRRDDLPAYHLVSVIEDRDLGTTHIVRGEDLVESTAAQLLLAPHLAANSVADATYLFHGLLVDEDGTKLSKSVGSAGPLTRDDAMLETVIAAASRIGAPLGILRPT